jgi:hypothetical protein
MKYTIEYDAAVWFPVPAEFPTEEWPDERQWLDSLVREFETDLGALTPDAQAAVHEFAIGARLARVPGTSESFLFCPRSVPVLGVVSVYVNSAENGEALDLEHEASADDRAQLPPATEKFRTEHLGTGRRAAVVIGSSDGLSAAGRYNYAFQSGGGVVTVSGTADGLQEAAMMEPFLDELVRGIRLEA